MGYLCCCAIGSGRTGAEADVGRLDSMDWSLHFTISSSRELSLSFTKVNSLTPILECAQCESLLLVCTHEWLVGKEYVSTG